MAFVRFTKPGARLGKPQVSIWSRGQIGFNQGAVEEYNLTQYKYLVLFYDSESNRVGFRFTTDKNENGAIKLVFRGNAGLSLSAIAFLKTFKIKYGETRTYNLDYDENERLFTIDLNNPLG
jgi:hypothetical protein